MEIFLALVVIAAVYLLFFRRKDGVADPRTTWHRSSKGNLTKLLPGNDWATIFPSDGGWKFSAPYPDDVGIDWGDEAHFSPPFETEDEARENAEAFLRGEARAHESLWDKNRRKNDASLPEGIPRERMRLQEIEAAVGRHEAAKSPKVSTLLNLLERTQKRQKQAPHLRNLMRERLRDERLTQDAEDLIREYDVLASRIQSIVDRNGSEPANPA